MRGVILSGGSGTRLRPSTLVTNKHLLPVFDKPMIYYPLTSLILMGIRDITVVCNEKDLDPLCNLLGNGCELGLAIDFVVQDKPLGLSDALKTASVKHQGEPFVVILGDNVFHGRGLGRNLAESIPSSGSKAFCYQVSDPHNYGVVKLKDDGLAELIVEKPQTFVSNLALTGLYYFDETAHEKLRNLDMSERGEFEITSLLDSYLKEGSLTISTLPRGSIWIDVGTHQSLLDAANYIKFVQERTGMAVGNPQEAAAAMGLIKP